MIERITKNDESKKSALPYPQIVLVSLNNKPQVAPLLSLYAGLSNSFGRYYPSTNSSPNKIHDNLQYIVWYSLPNFQDLWGTNINPGQVYLLNQNYMNPLRHMIYSGVKYWPMFSFHMRSICLTSWNWSLCSGTYLFLYFIEYNMASNRLWVM